jgi:hypothetical protein
MRKLCPLLRLLFGRRSPDADLRAWRKTYLAALSEERRAWEAAERVLPGTPGHDPAAWERWCVAVRRCDAIAREVPVNANGRD